jgi:hypothetical protein
MKINLESEQQGGSYFVRVDHMRDGSPRTTFLRMEDIKSWESNTKSKVDDRWDWTLTTVQGDVYHVTDNFRHIMSSADWYPREVDVRKNGRRTWEQWTK